MAPQVPARKRSLFRPRLPRYHRLSLYAVAYDFMLLTCQWCTCFLPSGSCRTVDLFIGLLMQLGLVSFWVFFGLW